MIRIAVVSDLHPQLYNGKDSDSSFALDEKYEPLDWTPASQLFHLIQEEKLSVDVLVCAGDIGDKGDPELMQAGWNFLNDLFLSLNAYELITVPGNHDHDSRLIHSKYDPKHNLQAIKPYFPFQSYDKNTHFWSWHWAFQEFMDITFFSINSSAFHGVRRPAKPTEFDEIRHGRIGPATINTLERKLRKVDNEAIKIGVTHHHPIRNGTVKFPDYEAMDGGDQLLNMISETCGRNWLIIHGHLHWPGILNAHGNSADPPIIFSAGSLSGPLDSVYHKDILNQFYIIELHDEKIDDVGLVGTFKTWDWTAMKGWHPAKCKRGLPAHGGFGYRPNVSSFASAIDNAFESLDQLSSEYGVSYDLLLEKFPDLPYLSPTDLDDLKDKLSGRSLDLDIADGKIVDLGRKKELKAVMSAPSIFESFNARDLRPEQVARSFVPSDAFEKLRQRHSSLLIGPRGSGKTTLMRMIECETASYWTGPRAEQYKAALDFVGVFIPTERVWRDQMDALTERGDKDTESLRNSAVSALFTSHVIYRVAKAMDFRLHINETMGFECLGTIDLSLDAESDLVNELARVWRVDPMRPTFKSLLSSCSEKKAVLAALSMADTPELTAKAETIPDIYRGFNLPVEAGIEVFDAYSGNTGEKWMLLFDELELAPSAITSELLSMARGSNEKILYKLSLAPYLPDHELMADIFSPQPGHDFSTIILWHSNQERDAQDFFKNLTMQIMREEDVTDSSIDKLLQSPKELGIDELYQEMLGRDKSLRSLFDREKLPHDTTKIKGEKSRSKTIRKLKPILTVRKTHTRTNDSGKLLYKSLNRYPDMYAGPHNIATILEGNPRWIIGVMRPLVKKYKDAGESLPIHTQMAEIESAANKFLSLLRSIPCGNRPSNAPTSAKSLLDVIGDYISDGVNIWPIKLDVNTYFKVNRNIPQEIKNGLGSALNAGALVYMPGGSQMLSLHSLGDRDFRICHLLSPKYRLPLSPTKPYSLLKILNERKAKFPVTGDLFK